MAMMTDEEIAEILDREEVWDRDMRDCALAPCGTGLEGRVRTRRLKAPARQLMTNDRRNRMAFGITVNLSSLPS